MGVGDLLRHTTMRTLTWICRNCFPKSHELQVERVTIKSTFAKYFYSSTQQSLRIIHLSDFHYQFPDSKSIPRIYDSMLEEIIEKVNGENADLILLTGDFVQSDPTPITELVAKYFSRMKCKYGIFAVNGNHCNKTGPSGRDFIFNELQRGGIKVLFNSRESPLPGVEIVGVGDISIIGDFNPELAFKGASDSDKCFRIVLSHNPDTATTLRKYSAHLQLSGHTHGALQPLLSQVDNEDLLIYVNSNTKHCTAYRNLIPGSKHFKVVTNWQWCQGLHRVSKVSADHREVPLPDAPEDSFMWLYTNRGLATHPPLRFLCPPEMTVIEIIPK